MYSEEGSEDLPDDVQDRLEERNLIPQPDPESYGWVELTAANVHDGGGEDGDSETMGESDAKRSDIGTLGSGSDDRRDPGENETECRDELGDEGLELHNISSLPIGTCEVG
jgi:hypothetical protein